MTASSLSRGASALAIIAALSACGGGGGGGPTPGTSTTSPIDGPAPIIMPDFGPAPTPTAPTPAPSAFDTAQYRASAASLMSAASAYDKGAFGQGVKVAVIDSGTQDPAGALTGRLVFDPATQQVANRDDSSLSHGSRIASIIGARQGGSLSMHGVAPQADIYSYNVSAGGGDMIGTADAAKAIDAAAARGVHVTNISFGSAYFAGQRLDVDGMLQAAIGQAAEGGMVFVVAAGNSSNAQPTTLAAMPLYFDASFRDNSVYTFTGNPLNGRFISVAALDTSGEALAEFSNACGMTKNFCISTRGVDVKAAGKTGAVTGVNGTSFAAPQVAGAFALLKSMWPSLTEREVVEILLRSADDIGVAGIDDVFGYGRLNVDSAINPIGALKLPKPSYTTKLETDGTLTPGATMAGASAGGTMAGASAGGEDVSGSMMVASAAMGPALRAMAASGPAIAVFDEFGRGFRIDMQRFATEARKRLDFSGDFTRMASSRDLVIETAPGVKMRLQADPSGQTSMDSGATSFTMDGMNIGVARHGRSSDVPGVASFRGAGGSTAGVIDIDSIENPYLALLGDIDAGGGSFAVGKNGRMGVFYASGDTETGRGGSAYGVTAGYDFDGVGVALTAGQVSENAGMLGGSGSGVFAFGDSDTQFASMAARAALGEGWSLTGDLHYGRTTMKSGGTLISGGDATSTAWNIGLENSNALVANTTLAASVGQPLNVGSGAINFSIPTETGLQGSKGSLKTAQEFNFRLGASSELSDNETLSVGGILRMNADGVQGETDAGVAIIYQAAF